MIFFCDVPWRIRSIRALCSDQTWEPTPALGSRGRPLGASGYTEVTRVTAWDHLTVLLIQLQQRTMACLLFNSSNKKTSTLSTHTLRQP